MTTDTFDVPQLLSRRKKKHLVARGAAELIDIVLFLVASALLNSTIGDSATWIIFPAMFVYFVLMEALSGQTIGKRVTNLRVVNSAGQPPTIGQSLMRNVIRPFEAFGLLGVIVVAFTDKGQRIGDLLASTFVIHTNELQDLATTQSNLRGNELQSSREVIPISGPALQLAKEKISAVYNPAETCLSITIDESLPHRLAVQLDLIETSDDSWNYTTDGVTISVPRAIADSCKGLQVVVQDGKLVVDRAT